MVNGTPVQVSLDTGKSGGIEFYRPTTERFGLQERAAAGELAQRRGARGTRTVRTGELEAIRLGPFVVENASVSFSDKGTSKELREGNAGNLFLKNFVLTVDYVERSIIFEQ